MTTGTVASLINLLGFITGLVLYVLLLWAAAFSALCFLPAVVVHSALRAGDKTSRAQNLLIAGLAYAMSGVATLMHFGSAITNGAVPSQFALRGVTIGFVALLIVLLLITRGQTGRGRVLWVVAMSVFAVSALHLSNHEIGQDPWWLQPAGLLSSLPPALLILYQDFPFPLRRFFPKRCAGFHPSRGID